MALVFDPEIHSSADREDATTRDWIRIRHHTGLMLRR